VPWVLFVGFVLPHPPYIAPPELYDRYPTDRVPMPPQWYADDWPSHPVLAEFRRFFDFDRPFDEETVRRLNAAYLGACTHMDRQIGRIMDTLERLDLTENTRIIYTSDHGENRGARGLFGKFTMYEESVGVPLAMCGPGVPIGKVVRTPVSLVDCYPTVLEAVGAENPAAEDLPGESLFALADEDDRERAVFSEYHALGARRGFSMLARGRYKYVHYVEAPPQLFDLDVDPREENDLAASPEHAAVRIEMERELRSIADPEEVDRRAREDQRRLIDRYGGPAEVVSRGAFDNSPVPGEAPRFHI
jgi:choline-sulfatase